jgi:hypothetical protein
MMVNVEVLNCDLTAAQARKLARTLERMADQTEPLDAEGYSGILATLSDVWGTKLTVEDVADQAGVDLATATHADRHALEHELGQMMAGRREFPEDTSVRIGPVSQ